MVIICRKQDMPWRGIWVFHACYCYLIPLTTLTISFGMSCLLRVLQQLFLVLDHMLSLHVNENLTQFPFLCQILPLAVPQNTNRLFCWSSWHKTKLVVVYIYLWDAVSYGLISNHQKRGKEGSPEHQINHLGIGGTRLDPKHCLCAFNLPWERRWKYSIQINVGLCTDCLSAGCHQSRK